MVGVQYSSAVELKVNQNKHQMDPLDIKAESFEDINEEDSLTKLNRVSGSECQMGLPIKKESLEESDEMFVDFEAVKDLVKDEIKEEDIKSGDSEPKNDNEYEEVPLAVDIDLYQPPKSSSLSQSASQSTCSDQIRLESDRPKKRKKCKQKPIEQGCRFCDFKVGSNLEQLAISSGRVNIVIISLCLQKV